MRDLKLYWQEVRSLEKSLPEFVWLTSLERGRVVEVPARRAAVLLHAESHRVATEEEVREHREGEDAVRRGVRNDELRGRGVAVVAVPEGRRRKPAGSRLAGRVPAPLGWSEKVGAE